MILKHLPKNNGILQAHVLVEELVRNGVDTFFVAPGSRSTPLVVAVAANPKARAFVHFDERGTAFAALGYARGSGLPAAWITTSGSAVANGFPAVVEAAQDSVPLIMLTADRPPELRGVGANQSIDQAKLFGSYVAFYADLPAASTDRALRTSVRIASQASWAARTYSGPVHVNCQFREPFGVGSGFDSSDGLLSTDLVDLRAWFDSSRPLRHGGGSVSRSIDALAAEDLTKALDHSSRGLVIVGAERSESERDAVVRFCNAVDLPVLIDPLSQLRSHEATLERRVEHYDQLLAIPEFAAESAPDLIIHVGGRLVSKSLLTLVGSTDAPLFRISESGDYNPTERSQVVVGSDYDALATLIDARRNRAVDWLTWWEKSNATLRSFFGEDLPFGEPLVARDVARLIPRDWDLFVGNSMPIRDVDRFASTISAHRVFANRGASGIDGNVATAFGISVGSNRPVLALVGDLTLLHDLNSLGLLSMPSYHVTIVVVNNDGGGIFSFLPISGAESVFEPFFGTGHGMSFSSAAKQFGLPYESVAGERALAAALSDAFAKPAARIIEVSSNRSTNRENHDKLTSLAKELIGRE